MKIQQLFQAVRTRIVELNLFPDDSVIGHEKIERQRWATYLFLLSLGVIFLVLMIYIAIGQHNTTIVVYTPNQSEYINLLNLHPSIRCPCMSISIKYEQFVNASPTYHQICSSDFINWNFYQWLYVDFPTGVIDFRYSAISYFAFLEHLCAQARVSVERAYGQFLQKEYITDVLLTPEIFNIEAQVLINTLIEKTTNRFALSIQTIQKLTAASQFISQYQTSSSSIITSDYQVFLIQNDFHHDRLFSNHSCFCGRNLTCQRPAGFYDPDTYALLETIDGLIFSCLPFESLLASSFACFYNETCLNRTFSWFDESVS